MHFWRRLCQALPVVAALSAGVCLLALGAPYARAQSSSSSSGSSLLGGTTSSLGSSSSSLGSSSSSGSLLGSSTSGSLLGSSTGSLTGSGTLTGSTTGSMTGSTYRPPSGNMVGPSQSNIVAAYYNNPLQYGLPNSTSTTGGASTTKTFGSPLFVTANTSNSSANVSRGNANSGNTSATTPAAGISVGPRYTQSLGWKMPNVPSARMQTQLQSLIASSQGLTNPKGIQVSVEGQTVVLKGSAADEHERILAGAILGMSPGVGDVRNELKIQAPTGSPPAGKQP